MLDPVAPPPEADSVRLPFELSSVTAARGIVTDTLTALGADRAVIADANIVVGELVMNAVRHGRPHDDGTIEVTWALRVDALRFSVCDGGRVDRLEASMPSAATEGGRGLAMVDLICRCWSYDTTDGTRVVADIPAPLAPTG